MVRDSLTNCCSLLKDDMSYKSVHEALCAKLQQAQTIADIAATGDFTDGQMNRLIWCLADMLTGASEQCESLTAEDFQTDK